MWESHLSGCLNVLVHIYVISKLSVHSFNEIGDAENMYFFQVKTVISQTTIDVLSARTSTKTARRGGPLMSSLLVHIYNWEEKQIIPVIYPGLYDYCKAKQPA